MPPFIDVGSILLIRNQIYLALLLHLPVWDSIAQTVSRVRQRRADLPQRHHSSYLKHFQKYHIFYYDFILSLKN
jgi:hypothetical protein